MRQILTHDTSWNASTLVSRYTLTRSDMFFCTRARRLLWLNALLHI